MKVLDLLTDESKWTQGTLARTKSGSPTALLSCDAVCYCLEGAIARCYNSNMFQTVMKIIRQKVGLYAIHKWNDHPNRTFAEVRALIEELDI